MNPYHDRKSSIRLKSFLGHSNIQVQALELVVTWNGVVDTACNQNLAFSLWAPRTILRRVKRGLKGMLCLAVCPPLIKCGVWHTPETGYAFLYLAG
jgi:hypothetical protein